MWTGAKVYVITLTMLQKIWIHIEVWTNLQNTYLLILPCTLKTKEPWMTLLTDYRNRRVKLESGQSINTVLYIFYILRQKKKSLALHSLVPL